VSAPADFAELARRFAGSAFEGVSILGEVGRGRRSRVYRCLWNGRECALKVHALSANERHRRLTGQGIAEFEYARNLAYYRAPGMSRFVAQPLGFVADGATQALAQELLRGEIYYEYYRKRGGAVAASIAQDLARMVELAHAAELFDMDLHSMNVMVVEEHGAPVPKLFDFNLIPFTVRPQNFLVGWLLKAGFMSRRSRDLRRLRNFHDFGPIERRLKRRATES
jgi:tRNA A-37 threonylcarbamoyl transferase component Bud32